MRVCAAGAALVFGLTLVLFWPVLGHDFINFDTPRYVTNNPVVNQGLTPGGVVWALTAFEVSNWHPVTWWSHMLDVSLFGLKPGAHHGVSMVLHGINGALLFGYLARWTGQLVPALVVALLFVAHPMHVESVAWIAERKDLLSTCLLLMAMHAHASFAASPSLARYLLLGSLVGLGLMSKAMLVTAPFVLLLLDYWPLGRIRSDSLTAAVADLRKLVAEKLPLFALVLVVIGLTLLAQGGGSAMDAGAGLGLADRVANALVAMDHYLRSAFWPAQLALF